MADEKLLEILKQGPGKWNALRQKHSHMFGLDLSEADLSGVDLSGANLVRVNLTGATLIDAVLQRSNLNGADLTDVDLGGVDLSHSYLFSTNFARANLSGTKFHGCKVGFTVFADVNLTLAEGLETLSHLAASDVSISTIYNSEGKIPEKFLLGCGVPESFIAQIPALVGALQPIQFHSCFISYSSRDEEFAKRLHERMRAAGLRVWFAPEDMKGGRKLFDQIDRAIQVHDRLLLVLSESSMRSKWVEQEIRRARKVEVKEGRQKLFPIRVVGYEELQAWECLDSTSGEDLAEEVRSYFIPDFSNWKSHDDFEREFARLYASLKAAAA